jgi:hypothetical protein
MFFTAVVLLAALCVPCANTQQTRTNALLPTAFCLLFFK